jgi:hypothetical protein
MEPHISQRGRWQQQPWQQRRPCPAERLESGGTPNARPGRGSGRLDAYRVLIAVVDAAVDVARWRDKPLRRCIKSRRSFTTLLVEEAAGMAVWAGCAQQRRNSGEDGEPEASFGKTICAATPLMRTARARPIRKCCTRCADVNTGIGIAVTRHHAATAAPALRRSCSP